MIRILIVDDHAIVRRGLRQIVAEQPDMQVDGGAGDAHEAMEMLQREKWDVLVLDINMPGRGGLELLNEVKQHWPNLPVLILSMHPEDQFAKRVLKSGAAGYLAKDSAPLELVKAIRKVHGGGKYVSEAMAEKLALALHPDADRPLHELLSDREYQVLCRIASGETVSEIAADMMLSVKSISTYRTRILEKMKLRTSAELTHYAIKNGLVS
jgi:two-component system, NarL family, invasion response regulator UvrY